MKKDLEQNRTITIEEKIDFIVEWKRKYPDASISPKVSIDLLRKYGENEQEQNQIIEDYEKVLNYYGYIKVRKANGKLTEEQIRACTDAKIGSAFKIQSEEDAEESYLMDMFDLKEETIRFIRKKYGSVEKFREKYIEALISEKVDEVIPKKILKEASFITEFDVGSPDWIVRNETFVDMQLDLLFKKCIFTNYNGVKELYEKILNEGNFNERQIKIMSMYYGVNGEKKCGIPQIADQINRSRERVRQIILKHQRKIRHPKYLKEMKWYDRTYTIDSDLEHDIIKEYFNNHDIFKTKDVIPMEKDEVNKLNEMLKQAVEKTQRREEYRRIISSSFSKEQKIELYKTLYGKEPAEDIVFDNKSMDSDIVKSKIAEYKICNYDYYKYDEHDSRNEIEALIDQCAILDKEKVNKLKETAREDLRIAVVNKINDEIANLKPMCEIDKFEDILIEDMNLSERAYNVLIRAGIKTNKDFIGKSRAEISNIRNLGKVCFDEISEKLKEYGIEYVEDTLECVLQTKQSDDCEISMTINENKLRKLDLEILNSEVLSDEEKETYRKALYEKYHRVKLLEDEKANLIKRVLKQQEIMEEQQKEIFELYKQKKGDR